MSDAGASERTEDPTPKKLRDAIAKGDVLQSRELATALSVGAGCAALIMLGPWLIEALRLMLAGALRFDAGAIEGFAPGEAAVRLVMMIVAPMGAILAITVAASIAPPVLLGALRLRGDAIAPRWQRLNPLAGFKRMVSVSALNELAKACAKSLLVGGVGVWLLMRHIDLLRRAGPGDVAGHLSAMAGEFRFAMIALCGGLAMIALIDVPVQFVLRRGRLRMSKQEVKDEHRQSEGSPELRGQIRRRQMEIVGRSTRSAVKEATVVLANPRHFAVALRYDPGRDRAPVIVARGRDAIARAIRELAGDAGVRVVSHPALTRAIYFTGKVGDPIAEELYLAVAAVLAFIGQVDADLKQRNLEAMIAVPGDWRFDAEGKRGV